MSPGIAAPRPAMGEGQEVRTAPDLDPTEAAAVALSFGVALEQVRTPPQPWMFTTAPTDERWRS